MQEKLQGAYGDVPSSEFDEEYMPCPVYSFAVLLLLVAAIIAPCSALYMRLHKEAPETLPVIEIADDFDLNEEDEKLELAEND